MRRRLIFMLLMLYVVSFNVDAAITTTSQKLDEFSFKKEFLPNTKNNFSY